MIVIKESYETCIPLQGKFVSNPNYMGFYVFYLFDLVTSKTTWPCILHDEESASFYWIQVENFEKEICGVRYAIYLTLYSIAVERVFSFHQCFYLQQKLLNRENRFCQRSFLCVLNIVFLSVLSMHYVVIVFFKNFVTTELEGREFSLGKVSCYKNDIEILV